MISPNTIALVRERTDVVALIQESVPSLKRRGRSFVGLCPFHKEKSPSFHVNQERGFFHCFGCKESGSGIDFLMKLEGLTFPEAVRALAERAGIEVEEERTVDRTEADRQKKAKDDLYSVNNLAAVFFEKMLREHPDREFALRELGRRGLTPKTSDTIDDVLQAFRIGYAPPSWDGFATFLKQQGVSPLLAEQVGLLVPRSSGSGHYDRFRHRLMFAVVDQQGRVVAFSGRALDPHPDASPRDKEEKPAKYMNSPESAVYSKGHTLFGLFQARHAIRTAEEAVIVEGNFDVVSLHARGFANVVAPLGTAFTVDQAKLLKRFAGACTLLFDGDAAGRKAVRLSRTPLKEAGITPKVAPLPDGVDPDDLVRTKGPQALTDVLGRAVGLIEFLIEDALDKGFAEADGREKAARVAAVSKLIAEEDDPLLRMMTKTHADRFAGRIDLKTNDWRARRMADDPFRALEQAVKQALRNEDKSVVPLKPGESLAMPKDARIAQKTPGAANRAAIIGALLEYPALLKEAPVVTTLDMLEGPSVRTVAAISEATARGDKPLDVDALLARVPAQVQSFVARRLAAPEFDSIETARAEIEKNGDRLREMLLASDTRELAHEAARASGDWDAEIRAAQALSERVRGLKAPAAAAGAGAKSSVMVAPAPAPAAPPASAPSEASETDDYPESAEVYEDGTSRADDSFYGAGFDESDGHDS